MNNYTVTATSNQFIVVDGFGAFLGEFASLASALVFLSTVLQLGCSITYLAEAAPS